MTDTMGPYDRFWVQVEGRRWHLAERQKVTVAGKLRIVYILRCSESPFGSEALDEVERDLPESVSEYDICGHNPCAREKKRRRTR